MLSEKHLFSQTDETVFTAHGKLCPMKCAYVAEKSSHALSRGKVTQILNTGSCQTYHHQDSSQQKHNTISLKSYLCKHAGRASSRTIRRSPVRVLVFACVNFRELFSTTDTIHACACGWYIRDDDWWCERIVSCFTCGKHVSKCVRIFIVALVRLGSINGLVVTIC